MGEKLYFPRKFFSCTPQNVYGLGLLKPVFNNQFPIIKFKKPVIELQKPVFSITLHTKQCL